MNEQLTPTTQIIQLGRLSERKWPGFLTVDDRKVDLGKIITNLDEFYVATKPNAKTRCIDGRHDPELDEANLGPQVPAGAPGAALAYRLGVDKDDLTRGTFLNDADVMIDSYLRLGLAPGGHRDNQGDHGGVGCGAIDGVQNILDQMTNPDLVEDHKRLVKLLLAEGFDRDNYLRVMGAGLVLESRANGYFAEREQILDLLEQKCPNSVSRLQGGHQEGIVIVNLVPNSTLASNRFFNTLNIQAFGYDLWRSKQLAQALLPLPSQTMDRERFVTARVMLSVATLMSLTDGSLQLLVRVPVGPDNSLE
jgi:hypothetical protein